MIELWLICLLFLWNSGVFLGSPTDFVVDTQAVAKYGQGVITCVVTNPSGSRTETFITPQSDGMYKISYTPIEEGTFKLAWIMNIKYYFKFDTYLTYIILWIHPSFLPHTKKKKHLLQWIIVENFKIIIISNVPCYYISQLYFRLYFQNPLKYLLFKELTISLVF